MMMRNWNVREFLVRVNLPMPIRLEWLPIWCVITLIRGFPNTIRQVVPLISHILSYPPHHSHVHPPSLSFLSTTLPLLQNRKLSHPSLSLYVIIMSWQWVQHTPSTAYTEYSIHQTQHTPSTEFTKYSIHQVLHTPSIAYTEYIIHRVQHTPSAAYTECSIHRVQLTQSAAYTECSIHPRLIVFLSSSWWQVDPWM